MKRPFPLLIILAAITDITSLYLNLNTPDIKELTPEHFKPTVLVIDGDSMYNIFTNEALETRLKLDNTRMRIYKDPDSIKAILGNKLRAIMVIERKEED